jgi:hypothetical protein
VWSVLHGFRQGPSSRDSVQGTGPNSGALVLPMTMNPARRIRATFSSSNGGTNSAKTWQPNVVRTPSVRCRS